MTSNIISSTALLPDIIGYWTARSRDRLIFAARQELTRQQWRKRRHLYELVTSELVVEEGLGMSDLIQFGASPRATIDLTLAAKANAFLAGRGYVVPQDVKGMALDVLRHRVNITYEAEAEEKTSEDVVRGILDPIAVP